MLLGLLAATGWAADIDAVLARIDEVSDYRSMRITEGVPSISEDEYRRAATGEIPTRLVAVDGTKAKKVYGVAVVDVPIDRFWSAINDEDSKVEYTKLGYAEVLLGNSCEPQRRVFQYLPVPIVTDRWWVSDQRMNTVLQATSQGRVRELTWKTTDPKNVSTESAREWARKGMPVDFAQGGWFLVDLDGTSTLVEYYSWSDPGGNVPMGAMGRFAAGGIPDMLATFTDLARTGPTCKLD